MRKIVVALFTILSIVAVGSLNVEACSYTSECGATSTYKTHLQQFGTGAQHTVREPNGYTSECYITYVSGYHNNYCSGCDYLIEVTNEMCSETHTNTHCYNRNNICGARD